MTTLAKLVVALGLDAKEYDKGLDDAEGKASGFGSKIGGFLGSAMKMGLAATAGGVIAAIGGIVKGVASNAEFERYQTQFGVLLGSTEKAKERLADLAKFGASTPFELPEVVNADKILQGFGLHSEEAAKKFGFSGAQIRTIAGDVASGTGSSFEEMSLLLGKFSAGATGEAISRMAELGIASRADLAKMGLEFDKSGALLSPLPKAMNVVLKLMQTKYGGMMQAQSATFEGMISNLQDWVSGTLRTVSQPIFEVLKTKLGDLLAFLGDPSTQAILDNLATTLSVGVGNAIDFISNTVIPDALMAWDMLNAVFETVRTVIQGVADEIQILLGNDPGDFGTSWVDTITELADGLGHFLQPVLDTATFLLGRIAEIIVPLIPDFSNLAGTVQDNGFPELGAALATVYNGLVTFSNFVKQNADAVLVGLGSILVTIVVPAFIAWAVSAGAAAIATIVALAPVLLVLAAVGVAAALLYTAWNTNFLGIRDTLINIWNGYVLPAFTAIQAWLAVAIPVALQATSDFLNNTLIPAFNAVWSFIDQYVIPIFVTIVQVHIAAFKAAIQALANFWTNILWPALKAVYNFLNTYVVPLFKAIVNVNIAVFMLALRTLAAVWQTVLLPALTNAWNYLNQHVIPILIQLYDQVIEKGLKPALQAVAFFILGTLIPQFMAIKGTISGNLGPALDTAKGALNGVKDAFGHISDAIKDAIKWIQSVADKLNSIHVPDWLQGHSPPPMANWFGDIGSSAQKASGLVSGFGSQVQSVNANVNAFHSNVERLASANRDIGIERKDQNNGLNKVAAIGDALSGNSTTHNWTINGNFAPQPERTIRDEIRMQAMLLNTNPTG